MYNFKANDDILPLSEFRSNLAGYITQTRETKRPIIVTQNGRPHRQAHIASSQKSCRMKLV